MHRRSRLRRIARQSHVPVAGALFERHSRLHVLIRVAQSPTARRVVILVQGVQARRLEALWLNTGRDWNEAESIAGLWAYAQTYGKGVSRLPGSPVVDVALRIGRAVTGVYNKVMNFGSIDPRDSRAGLGKGALREARVRAHGHSEHASL